MTPKTSADKAPAKAADEMMNRPGVAKRLHAAAKKVSRIQARREWWAKHGDDK